MRLGKDAERLRRGAAAGRTASLTLWAFAVRRPAVPERAPRPEQAPPRRPYTAHASGICLLSAASRRLYRETLRGYERRLVAIGGELKRIKECAGLSQRVAEEAETFVRRFFEVVAGFPAEVVAVAVLWTAAKATSAPRPLEDFLKCSKADERRARKAAWRLKEAVKQSRRPSIEDYVKTLVARVDLPASIARSAVGLLEKNGRLLFGKNPWVSAAALWLASFKKLGLLKALAEASGTTTASIRNAAKKLRI